MSSEKNQQEKARLHSRNKNRERYDLSALTTTTPELKNYIMPNKFGVESVDFSNPLAVRLLNKALLNHYYGGVKKRSNISNAKPHQGNKYQFTTDLQAFYPNIKFDRVFDTFLKLGFSNHYSHWLTKITTWKYELPQGTPTSTHISNLVFLETDFILIDLCNKNNIAYTRYIDDLTVSSQKCFKYLLNDILKIVTESGFKISYRKTKYAGNQNITGIDVFNNFIDAPDKILIKSKEEIKKEFKPYTNYLNNIRKTNKRKPIKKASVIITK